MNLSKWEIWYEGYCPGMYTPQREKTPAMQDVTEEDLYIACGVTPVQARRDYKKFSDIGVSSLYVPSEGPRREEIDAEILANRRRNRKINKILSG